jgi:indolepyruvate ferredoxin oxidoreductase alpha subunit
MLDRQKEMERIPTMVKEIMSGNEAIARGAWEAGCSFASAYPGTPSTEIIENLSAIKEISSRWANNEKTALEMAIGASIGGLRSLAAMKHVGLNVAADPLCAVGYTGVNAGLVVVTADDPGCHSSQNEQDNRLYALLAKVALVEPSDSQECKDFIKEAYEISERFDIPVLFRVTTRICHSKGLVELEQPGEMLVKPYQQNRGKYCMLPANARVRHVAREESLVELEKFANTSSLNRFEWGKDRKLGIVTSGISYQYAKEVFGDDASILKLGLTNPMPKALIKEFCTGVDEIYVIEEGEPFIENVVKALGFSCTGKDKVPILGELNASIVRNALVGHKPQDGYSVDVQAPPRPPVLCAGCPHRGFFFSLKKNKKRIVAMGDIGCYSLGVGEPFAGFETTLCMGAGISGTIGFSKALEKQGDPRKVLGMVGDSTFFHSGVTSLIDVIHADANVIACVLDNSITAMTGHQVNAGSNKDVQGYEVPAIDLVALIRGLGVPDERLRVVDPLDLKAVQEAFDAAVAVKGPFVIVTKRPCVLIKEVARANVGRHCQVDPDKCVGCKACTLIACPAMAFKDKKSMVADPASCTACGLCMQMCKFDAISRVGE